MISIERAVAISDVIAWFSRRAVVVFGSDVAFSVDTVCVYSVDTFQLLVYVSTENTLGM